MAYSLTEINRRCREDAAAFIADCDADYAKRLALAADRIMENRTPGESWYDAVRKMERKYWGA